MKLVQTVLRIVGLHVLGVTTEPVSRNAQQSLQESPCTDKLAECVEALGTTEITALYEWVATSPAAAYTLASATPADGKSVLESNAFALFAGLALQVFTILVDVLLSCRMTPERCTNVVSHFQHISSLADAFHEQMRLRVQTYALQSGVRSCIIQAAQNLRSQLLRYERELPSCVSTSEVAQKTFVLVDSIGQQSRLLAHQLAMHEWVRTLAVPGRGSPMFVLHDEYWSWAEMLNTHVGNMVRNGMPHLAVAHVGFSPEGAQDALLDTFEHMQYLGIIRDQSDTNRQSYLTLQERIRKYGSRASVYSISSLSAAAAIPLEALDIVLLHISGSYENVLQELELWQARIKPAGILAGHGFSPEFMEGVRAVCSLRFATDIHLGIDGTFWWFVEPEE